MAQQPNPSSQYEYGPSGGGGGDILHFIPANANASANNSFVGWVDNNGMVQGVQGVVNGFQNSAPVQVTALTGGIFQTASSQLNLLLPGNSRYEQIPFTVKAAGYVQMGAGTYTATVQPLIYALAGTSTAAAVVGNAIYSVAATTVTVSSATAVRYTWEAEAALVGDSVSGRIAGRVLGSFVDFNGTAGLVDLATIVQASAPTSLSFTAAAAPIAFAAGVTLTNPSSVAVVSNLGSFFVES